ncbi:hypothetical protein Cni_G27678 [Canna indica]|uniref:GrpE protein homolog n=1 Tax=Canna indica TaxID=4628 RepID=A0AAQ3L608_9LILI|nr:hypothetical protein Cni_G27678 [Canna indica]
MASRVFSRIARSEFGHSLISGRPRQLPAVSGLRSLRESAADAAASSLIKCSYQMDQSRHSILLAAISQRFGFSSSASPKHTDKEANQSADHDKAPGNTSEADKTDGSTATSEQSQEAGISSESKDSKPESRKRRKSAKRTEFSDSDAEMDLSFDDLVKLVADKEELLKLKHKEIEKMQDKVLRSYAEMENVIDRTKREAENSKKFAIQSFAKSLLDVADNLGRASSVVKDSFAKIDESKDSVGAVPLIKTLLEGVEMTEKQLTEVFKKFGVEKFDPLNEQFDPHRHLAVFQMPDSSKPPGTVAAVLKSGYMLYDRVLRPAEVGVTDALNNDTDKSSSQ